MENINPKIPEISIILPCRNEEEALPFCLEKIKKVIKDNNLSAEMIVSDSSTDKSPEIAKEYGAILIKHDKEGYGRAYLEAFKFSKGKYLFLADADNTYDFSQIPDFINQLESGYDFVIGNRFSGKIEKGAMPWPNRYIGTPVLSLFLKIFFGAKIKDSQSGIRAIKKDTLEKLNLQTSGMEFASEMIIKAIKNNLKIKEIPTNYFKRIGKSKLKPFSDAWKHIRFMLLYSPLFLFFMPGLLLLTVGIASMLWFYFGNPQIFGIKLFYHPLFLSSILAILGYQLIIFSAFAKIYSINHLGEKNCFFEKMFKYITLEKAGIAGILVSVLGLAIYFFIFIKWLKSGFGSLDEVKNSIVALTLIVLGMQTIFSSFMLSILGIKEN